MENIVEQAAKIIAPDAFDQLVWYDTTTGKPHDFGPVHEAKQKYLQSQAVCRAIEVLKLAAKTANLKRVLAQDETDRWEKLGIPRSILDKPEPRKIIASKF
jgi:hypothetical protein